MAHHLVDPSHISTLSNTQPYANGLWYWLFDHARQFCRGLWSLSDTTRQELNLLANATLQVPKLELSKIRGCCCV